MSEGMFSEITIYGNYDLRKFTITITENYDLRKLRFTEITILNLFLCFRL